jgi:hypothetical protein
LVGVTLDLEEHPVTDSVTSVSGVHKARALVAGVPAPLILLVGQALASKAVVLNVVGIVSEKGGDEGLDKLEAESGKAEVLVEGIVDGERNEVRHDNAVVEVPETAAFGLLELCLNTAGRYKAAVKTLPDEGPEVLVEGGGARVFLGGNYLVVTPDVLNPEVIWRREVQAGRGSFPRK